MNIVSTGRRILIVVAFAAISTTAMAGYSPSTAVVNSTERTFTVRFEDGSQEHYVVKYSAEVTLNTREDGHPSTFTHPGDNRQCHWTVTGAIKRQVALVSKTRTQYVRQDLETVYAAEKANKGSDFLLTSLQSENCGKATDRRNSDFSNLQTRVRTDFNGTVEQDLKAVKEVFKSSADVVKIEGI